MANSSEEHSVGTATTKRDGRGGGGKGGFGEKSGTGSEGGDGIHLGRKQRMAVEIVRRRIAFLPSARSL